MLLPNESSLLPMLLSANAKKLGYHHSVLSLSFRNLNFIYLCEFFTISKIHPKDVLWALTINYSLHVKQFLPQITTSLF